MKNFTRKVGKAALCLILTAGASTVSGQQIEKSLVTSAGERVGFLEYKPAEYATEGNVKHPVIIFLHGIGERGNGTTELKNVARIALPRMLRDGFKPRFTWNGKTETFLVISPQCPPNYGMWPIQMVNDFVEYVRKNLRADTNRIYITGLSMGGGGLNRYLSNVPAGPAKLAAAAPICTPCTFSEGSHVAKANLPYWAFHAADDQVAPASCTERAINMINSHNPKVKPLVTMWPTGGHEVWDRVYTDTDYKFDGVINIYEWFLGQNKSLPVNKVPVANAGADQKVALKQTVTLDAGASRDSDGRLVRYVWKKISGPNSGTIAAKMSTQPKTTVTGISSTGVYQYELAVVDDRAAVARDTVTITVVPGATAPAPAPKSEDTVVAKPSNPTPPVNNIPTKPTGNKPPVAGTTGDILIPSEWNWAPNVSAWPSKDEDGYIAKVVWTQVSGDKSCVIETANTVRTNLLNLKPGIYVFRATVYDDKGASDYADVKVSISYKGVVPEEKPSGNKPPLAGTTPDIVVPLEWNWAPNVSAWPSKDEDGYIARVEWTKVSGPASCKIESPNAIRTNLLNLVEGVYIFRATVYDDKGASDYADVKVTMTRNGQVSGTSAAKALLEGESLAPVPVTALSTPATMTLSPNPATSAVNLHYTSAITGSSLIRVYDASGRLVKDIPFQKTGDQYRHTLDITRLIRGLYYVEVKTGNMILLQSKFIKQ